MTTFGDLINDVLLAVEGWGLTQGRAAFTTASMTSGATSVTVGSADNLSEGVAEIEDELVYISSMSGSTVNISADGRGYRGTTAASHASGVRITMNPVVPRAVVKQKINDTIQGVYPLLKGKGSTTLTYVGNKLTYQLPADVEEIVSVTYDATGPSGTWPVVTRWRLDLQADTTEYTTGKSISLFSGVEQGRSVRVVYYKKPTALSGLSDTLATAGLQESARALIVAGAVWRLSSYIAAAMLRADSVEMDMMDANQDRLNGATRVAAYLRAQYDLELQEELRRQNVDKPVAVHWSE